VIHHDPLSILDNPLTNPAVENLTVSTRNTKLYSSCLTSFPQAVIMVKKRASKYEPDL
jgi:hypothetical protein